MLSRRSRRRLNQIISVILCATILAQSSPLPAWPYLRSRSDSRRPLAGVRPVRAAEKTTAGIAPRVLPTPSPAVPVSPQATPPPRSNQGRPVAVEAVSHLSALPQSLPHSASDFGPSGWAQRRSRIADSGDRNSQSPFSILHSPISNIPLTTGWNLISLPLEPPDTDPAAVLSSIAGQYNLAYAYDGCDAADPWKLYDPAAPPPANDLTAIDHRIGLWIEMTADATLDVAGTQPTSTDIPLCEGWNLIGYPLDEAWPVAEALASIEGKYDLIFAYDPTDVADPWEVFEVGVPAWSNDLQVMQAGRGFWVHATEDVTLTIAKPEPAATPTSTPTATPTLPPAEGDPPTAEITSPADGSEVTDFVDIVGTADDPDGDLVEYRLQYRPVGTTGTVSAAQRRLRAVALQQADAEWTTIAAGNAPVVNDVLGRLDPTLLLNGMFEIRLVAEDSEGQQTIASLHLVISGHQKIGHFTLSFTDLAIPVAGLDITVIRSYDSRDKHVGDFGVGWTMQLTSVELAESGVAGEDWEETTTGGFFPSYCIQPTQLHMVTVRFPNDEVHRFAPRITPRCQGLIPIQFATVEYVALPGTTSRLQPMAGSDVVILGSPGGPVELRDLDLNLYDPRSYTLTTRDGTSFVVDEFAGVEYITDPNGNSLTITPNDITHSTGRSVAFQRDGLGRITRITDPMGQSLTYSYDANGDLASVTDRQDNVTTFTYDGAHRLLEIHDPLGRRPARNEYDADGRLIATTDANNNRIEYTHNIGGRQEVVQDRLGNRSVLSYDDRGNIVSRTDPLGNTTTFTYDSQDNKLSETDPLGATTSWTYNASGDVLSQTDPLGNTTSWTYNSRGQVLSQTDSRGNTTTFAYDTNGNLTSRTDPLGNTTTYSYDARGLVASSTDALGNTVRFTYDSFGNPIQQTDPLGGVIEATFDANGNVLSQSHTRTTATGMVRETFTNEYDANGNLIRSIDPLGNSLERTIDVLGRVTSTQDQVGRITTVNYRYPDLPETVHYPGGDTVSATYDAENRLLTSTDQAGRTIEFVPDALGRPIEAKQTGVGSITRDYDPMGRLLGETDPLGRSTSQTYDAGGRPTSYTDAGGGVTTSSYDQAGNLVAETDALGHTTHYTYDEANNLTAITYADGTTTTFSYDELGRKVSETDQAGNAHTFVYDELGRLASVADPLGNVTAFGWDEAGNLTSITDARGRTTTMEYDAMGNRIRRTLPDGNFETWSYNAVGQVVSHTDFNGNTTTFTYNVKGQLAKKTYADGSNVSYTYDNKGLLTTVADSRGSTQYTRDTHGRITQVVHPDGNTIAYTYDLAGNMTSMTTPAGTTTYTYDSLNRLMTVTGPDGGVTTYTYDAVGNRTSVTYPNGALAEYTYDSLNRLTKLVNRKADGTVISSYAYTLGPAGNRLKVVVHSGRTVDYTYDDTYRLIEERITDPAAGVKTISYTYDAVGNRLTKAEDGVTTTYTYDTRDRLLTADGIAFTYDNNGNLLTRTDASGTTRYKYDLEDRLTKITASDGSVVTYIYDDQGHRVQKTSPTGTRTYLWDAHGSLPNVVLESDGSGAIVSSFTLGDDLISMKRNATILYYHYDGQMSTRQITDAAGSVTDEYTYDAFGNLLAHSGSTDNEFLFTGQQFDADAGFYYLRARYYDPATGRFATRDPVEGTIFDPPSLHKYVYGYNDPVNRMDPSGLQNSLIDTVIAISIVSTLATMFITAAVGAVGFALGFPPLKTFERTADAVTIGVSGSLSPGILLASVCVVCHFLSGVGGFEILHVFDKPASQWELFGYLGMSVSIALPSGAFSWSGYVGWVWNVVEPKDYSGWFFSVSAGVGFMNPFIGLPPQVTAFTGPPVKGGLPSAGFGMQVFPRYTRSWNVGTSWTYYWQLGPLQGVAKSVLSRVASAAKSLAAAGLQAGKEQLYSLWQSLITYQGPSRGPFQQPLHP
ncbi:MAG: RHS repeat-associated core domain-containing protein [Anaerolineae bacterium]